MGLLGGKPATSIRTLYNGFLTHSTRQIITGMLPFPTTRSNMHVMLRVIEGKLPDFDAEGKMSQVAGVCQLMKSCLERDPKKRPDATRCLSDVMWMASRECPSITAVCLTGLASLAFIPPIKSQIGRIKDPIHEPVVSYWSPISLTRRLSRGEIQVRRSLGDCT